MNPAETRKDRPIRVDAVADHRGVRRGPFLLHIEHDRGGGTLVRVEMQPAEMTTDGEAAAVSIAMPGLVNAHTHLDLSRIGPRPAPGPDAFTDWLEMVRTSRPSDPAAIDDAVRSGVELSQAGGVVAVGDIGGAPGGRPTAAAFRALHATGMPGVSFTEFFAMGKGEKAALEHVERFCLEQREDAAALEPGMRARLGLQPHAPYSCSRSAYRRAAKLAAGFDPPLPLSTHLAETPEERTFIADGVGPKRDFLEALGLWTHRAAADIGSGKHPVEHVQSAMPDGLAGWLLAHVNDASDAVIEILGAAGASVAYCPRAASYFGIPGRAGPHRYREMLDAGLNVCVGTDSIINLDTADRISPLDDMRLLHRRDGTDPLTLLRMATVNGAAALGLDPGLFEFEAGRASLGVLVLETESAANADPLSAVLASDRPPRAMTLHTGIVPA